MNAQYLDAHKFIATLHEHGVDCTETVINLVEYAVIEDVAPVVHARWVEDDDEMTCSNCSKHWNYCDNDTHTFNHCPNCGAKMDGEASE